MTQRALPAAMLHTQGHQAWVADALIMRDGKRAVTVGADGLGFVWNVATGKVSWAAAWGGASAADGLWPLAWRVLDTHILVIAR
jgi:hypothetical protein